MSTYRKPSPYRKDQTYRGLETAPSSTAWSLASTVRTLWAAPQPGAGLLRVPLHAIDAHADALEAPWGTPQAFARSLAMPLHSLSVFAGGYELPWGTSTPAATSVAVPLVELGAFATGLALPWADFAGLHARAIAEPWRSPTARSLSRGVPWGQLAAQALSRSALWRAVVARGGMVALPWGPLAARQANVRIDWPVEPGPGTDPITVPILPVYVMLPTVTAKRISDNAELPILGATLQCDLDSWAWTFSAPMAYAGKALIDPASSSDPIAIEISVNGYAWRMLVEGYDDNRRFGSKTLTIRGRSQSAQLAAPYAPRRTFTQGGDRTAAQLATDELFGTGWTLAWDAVDWLLPGGTFTYADLAPIDAISKLADAIGAAVLSDRSGLALQVVPTYAESPWAWGAATPYAILPAAILASGDGSWQGGQNANGVFVRSEGDSCAALVRLAGTDGANSLDMIVERTLVHADPVRERGRIALARAGVIKTETRTLPLFPSPADPGLIPPGALLEIEDVDETWRGMVRGIRIEAQRSGSALSVRQVLTMERQFR